MKMEKKVPLYLKVIGQLKDRIKEGDFEYDVPFATEERITKEYGVSRITAIRVLNEMEQSGLIYRKRGSGSFVTANCLSLLGETDEGNTAAEEPFIRPNKEVSLVALVLPFDIKMGGMMPCFDGINDVLNKGNCFVRIYNTNRKSETEAEILRSLLDNDIDGVICYPQKDNENLEIFNQFIAKNIPLVLIDKHIENMPISYVIPDNYNGAKMLCEYAIEKGHTNVGFLCVSDFTGVSSLRERYMGYAAAINEKGIELNLDNVLVAVYNNYYANGGKKKGREAADEYMTEAINKLRSSGVTAIMCQNDWVARDVITYCEDMGISVPEDIMVMGFDHINAFQSIDVGDRIVTVEQNFYEMGRKAGEVILKEMQDESGKCARVVVPVKLIANK